MDKRQLNVELELNGDVLPASGMTRDQILVELRRCRDAARESGFTLSDQSLERLADYTVVHADKPDLGPRLAQLIKEHARPLERQAGRMLTTQSGTNRKARRAAKAMSRRSV